MAVIGAVKVGRDEAAEGARCPGGYHERRGRVGHKETPPLDGDASGGVRFAVRFRLLRSAGYHIARGAGLKTAR